MSKLSTSRAAAAALALAGLAARGADAPPRPDVLFVAVDDLNDMVTLLDPNAPIATPNLQRLAARGVSFTRAYCASPACNPSRVALLTGRAPAATGVYGNTADWRAALPDAVTIPGHFRANGYRVEGAGKIFHHHAPAFADPTAFDEFLSLPSPPDAPMPPAKRNGLPGFGTANTDWGAWPPAAADAPDVRTVDWCVERLRQPRGKPLFLACGLFRPHMPFFTPPEWLARYPADRVTMPAVKADDLADIPAGGYRLRAEAGRFWAGLSAADRDRPGTWREAVRCYRAGAEFADAQVGRLLDALDATGRGADTVVVLWSDHGYQLGEKGCWEKFTLWEKATRVPFVVVAPGAARSGAACGRPISLLDLFPTLCELCGLPPVAGWDGVSLGSLLRNPDANWERPAVMTYRRGNHAVRSERWRYIRYADGSEELYDHDRDPHEWDNVAGRPDHAAVVAAQRKALPAADAPAVPDYGGRDR